MARIITKELALKILAKLKATKSGGKGRAHTEYLIEHNGQVIATTNIRHSSEKDLGPDHMPSDLHVGPSFAKGLGQCPKSHDDYIRKLQEDGIIDVLEEDNGDEG